MNGNLNEDKQLLLKWDRDKSGFYKYKHEDYTYQDVNSGCGVLKGPNLIEKYFGSLVDADKFLFKFLKM